MTERAEMELKAEDTTGRFVVMYYVDDCDLPEDNGWYYFRKEVELSSGARGLESTYKKSDAMIFSTAEEALTYAARWAWTADDFQVKKISPAAGGS